MTVQKGFFVFQQIVISSGCYNAQIIVVIPNRELPGNVLLLALYHYLSQRYRLDHFNDLFLR